MLTEVELINFRSYSKFKADTNADIVLIVGPNAAGKTNLLESIYFLSRLKSFRTSDNLLVKLQEDYFKIAGKYNDQKLEAMVLLTPKFTRQFKLNDLKVKKLNWKTFATVLFVPQDLNLFELGPSLRRKFLDQILSQISLNYALDLASMEHVLKQRAALFKQINENQANATDLDVWNQELARVSINITTTRQIFIEFLNQNISEIYKELTGFDSKIEIKYSSIEATSNEQFLDKLKTYETAEIRSGINLHGPHRDDFIILKDDILNTDNSSRGELRSQILSLKLLQAKYLDEHKFSTIILLDDVFSELDEVRRTKLLSSLKGHQIFITTTEEHHLPRLGDNVKVINLPEEE